MCCFFTILLFLGPRVAGVVWWIANPIRWVGSTSASAFSSALWPILGIIFLPWTTLMYLIIYPGGVTGFEWVWLGLAIVFDIANYAGGGFGNRDRIPG
jgi:hypothetical protein